MPILRMVDFCESYSPFHVCLTIRPSYSPFHVCLTIRPFAHLVYTTSHLSCRILFIFGILIGHDLSMRILYRFHGWLIFARVIAFFMFVWPYVRPHILCTHSPDDNSTPIELQEVHIKHGPVTATRKQFPLVLAWGTTIHKAQGKTVDQLVRHHRERSSRTNVYSIKSSENLRWAIHSQRLW